MNWLMVGCVTVLAFGCAFLVGVIYAAVVLGSRADDEMDEYMASRERDEDPPTGI